MANKTTDKYLSLYPSDFAKEYIWKSYCRQLGVPSHSEEIRLYYSKDDIEVHTEEDFQNEEE